MNEGIEQRGNDTGDEQFPTVLSVAFPYAPVGPRAVGGAEVICSQLEAALSARQFGSVVVAHAASSPAGRLYGTQVPAGTITEQVRADVEARHQRNIDLALQENAVSLVHMHGLDFDRYHIPEDMPVLVTLHLPPAWYPETIWSLPANYHLVCVSQTQLGACPAAARDRLQVIGNGVTLPNVLSLRGAGRYTLMLARICREKNLHAGLDASRAAGLPALLAGEVFPYAAHLQYFTEEIEPRLTAEGSHHEARSGSSPKNASARFLGPVTGEDKARLFSRAACLLLPSLAPETSSLVAMEALAAGVPVVGMRVGAVPEIVEHGITGFLVDPQENGAPAMAEALRRIGEIDRATCRQAAEERFPLGRMIEAYLAQYRQLARQNVSALTQSAECLPREQQPEPEVAFGAEELETDLLTSTSALEAMSPQWEELWREDLASTPFQHPAWLLPWWRQFGPEGRLYAVRIRTRGSSQWVGLLPTYIYQAAATSERQLLLVGAGTTDYLDGLWKAPGVAGVALWRLLQDGQPWDALSLDQIRSGSALQVAAETAGLTVAQGEPCAVLDCVGELPAKIRANISRYGRRAEALGKVLCRIAGTAEEALADFALLVELSSQRWEKRGETAVLSDVRVQAHHRESLPLLLEAGLLRSFRVSVAGEPAGVLYGLVDGLQVKRRRLYLYLIGFAPRFAEISPGTLLLHAAWRCAQEEHLAAIDMLRGGEEYKQLWGAVRAPTVRLSQRLLHEEG